MGLEKDIELNSLSVDIILNITGTLLSHFSFNILYTKLILLF